MKTRITIPFVLLLVLSGGVVLAQTSPNFNLEWHVIGGGGHPVASAHYMVNSTAGQGAASPPLSASPHYAVSGGYWTGAFNTWKVYLPLVVKSFP